jgi:hypothetical protein
VRLLVCGGRDYNDSRAVFDALDRLRARGTVIDCIITGGARGADRLAEHWAWQAGVAVYVFDADWEAHGKAAGPIRNALMLAEGKPDGVVAFPGGSGTEDMVTKARAAGVKVWEPERA